MQLHEDVAHSAKNESAASPQPAFVKRWLWEAFCLLILAYTVSVIFGYIPSSNRLSTNEIALIGIVAAGTLLKVSPQWLGKLAKLKVGSLEFELSKVQREVTRVGGDLEHLRLMLAVTLPNLSQDLLTRALEPESYFPVDELVKRSLRRLVDQGLFVRRPSGGVKGENRKIRDIAPGESFLDTVTLTEQGKRVAELVSRVRRDEISNGEGVDTTP